MWQRPDGIQVLRAHDLSGFEHLCAAQPAVNVFAAHRGRSTSLDPRWLGGEVWGRYVDNRLVAACHAATNLVPVECDGESAEAFARHALVRPRRMSTIVGPEDALRVMWEVLRPVWGSAREERWRQPHLEIATDPLVEPDPRVRVTTRADLAQVHPACVAMYTEEVGVSPEAGGHAELYRGRVQQLIGNGWSFARFGDDGRLEFKAEVGCATDRAAQLQGVWVRPDLRGRGMAGPGMAAVVRLVRERIAPRVSLYVNAWNRPARSAYERVGFEQTATFATIMY